MHWHKPGPVFQEIVIGSWAPSHPTSYRGARWWSVVLSAVFFARALVSADGSTPVG
jgi:hypothetical protein